MVGICWYNPVISSTFVNRSWHIGDNMLGFFFWILSAFDLACCLVLSPPHGSLPALEDKLGCHPREVLDAVFLGSLLRRDSKDATFGDSLFIFYLLD